MRVILDFQALQSASRYRGVGRGSRSLMLSMANNLLAQGHEVVCLLNTAFQDHLEPLCTDILTNAPGVRLASFTTPLPCAAHDERNAWRQMAARLLREHAIASLEPDFVHVPALLPDGWGDDAVASVGELGVHVPISLTQHDLIPLVMSDTYMPPGAFHDYYMEKINYTKKADLLLAISDFSRKEAMHWLGLAEERVVHISSAADPLFDNVRIFSEVKHAICETYGIKPDFLMYAPGGFDPRKNVERLFAAYACLPNNLRARHQLIVVSKLYPGQRDALDAAMKATGLREDEVILTDYVPDTDLIHLYASCFLYIFPSLHEGFGLPALEAMLCGAPVLASDASCIPEVIGMQDALFDPFSIEHIAEKMHQALTDDVFRQRLLAHARRQPKRFSWEASAGVAVTALLQKHADLVAAGWKKTATESLPSCDVLLAMTQERVPMMRPDSLDVAVFRACYDRNSRMVHS